MNLLSTVTSKGQITLPVYIRKATKIKTGDKVYFSIQRNGRDFIIVSKKLKSLDELQGIFKKPTGVGKIEDLSWV
ncbi:AbrB family transcriptional regulator [Candidatus Shapirobacteria bacterium CG_4_8_14_3_um_filter_35_11]|uniref:AbrB family transcriptional regulator n=2 Tax=Candidatus Shapironibacteriota TaxID=1752721 RepID=A0A2M8L2E7_9BACT|nr:MAG: AbrB family transcriptional regulator [Candidatus Shapirobacteria bacterium CG_4_8_14_3_um_filter_35_11]PJE67089.1 MAG: AbrB family transcriptional regulator [Candidatus Shapirobacteria bacterium CG10_big_fil_rev_8_21_14_0_10_36_6]